MIGRGTRLAVSGAITLIFGTPAFAAEQDLIVEGGPAGRISFAVADLAALPRVSAERDDHGNRLACEGVLLVDLLTRAGLPRGDAVRGGTLTTVIVATARDGYRAAFTLGELDSKLGNAGAVVADRCGGKPLNPDTGPFRLVLPGDQRGARSVRQLQRLTITVPAAP